MNAIVREHRNRCLIPAAFGSCERPRKAFAGFLKDLGIDDDEANLWEVVFSELTENAIIHGCGRDPCLQVAIEWWREGQIVKLSVTDPGDGPPDDVPANPGLPENALAESGRGGYIVNQFATTVQHWRGNPGYCVVVGKDYGNSAVHLSSFDNPELVAALEELTASYESLDAFYRLGNQLIASGELSGFLRTALKDVQENHHYRSLGILPSPDLSLELLAELQSFIPPGAQKLCVKELERQLQDDTRYIWDLGDFNPQSCSLLQETCGCIIAIVANEYNWGYLLAIREGEANPFRSSEINQLQTYADLFGISLANQDLRNKRDAEQQSLKEMELAAHIQKNLLSIDSLPEDPRFSLFVRQQSVREVGGDFVQVTRDDAGNYLCAIIDVMGKGVPAALLAVVFRSSLRIHLQLLKEEPVNTLLERINDLLCHLLGDLTLFVTCSLVKISADCDWLEHANAGHCDLVLKHADGSLAFFEASGPPLGLFPNTRYKRDGQAINAGDGFLLFTDGCYEWTPPDQSDIYGLETFLESAGENAFTDPEMFWNELYGDIESSRKAANALVPEDDVTLLIWRRLT